MIKVSKKVHLSWDNGRTTLCHHQRLASIHPSTPRYRSADKYCKRCIRKAAKS